MRISALQHLQFCLTLLYPYPRGYNRVNDLQITIDIDASTPLFAQLITQIKDGVLRGGLQPGDPLPSIRQLANDLSINNKTVAKAYRLLERDSVIVTRGYRGTAIHPDALANSSVDLEGQVSATLAEAVSDLREVGATDSEIRIAFNNIMKPRGS